MADLLPWISKQVANQLLIFLSGVRNLSRESTAAKIPTFHVGDEIEFDVALKNNNLFPVSGLEVAVHQVQAVKFEEDPIVGRIADLASGQEEKVATVRGTVQTNPDDAKSPWRTLDYICRVTVSGEVNLPPIQFQHEEFEVAHIKDA